MAALTDAIDKARNEAERPSLVIVQTHIGFGSPKQDRRRPTASLWVRRPWQLQRKTWVVQWTGSFVCRT